MGGGVSFEERHVKSDIEVKFTPPFVRHDVGKYETRGTFRGTGERSSLGQWVWVERAYHISGFENATEVLTCHHYS